MENYKTIFDILWETYIKQNPQAKKVYDLFISREDKIVNDHVAFRTFDDKRINIDVLVKPFLKSGYVFTGDYHFEEKKLYAKSYEHKEDKEAPRVFVSQLKTKEFSPDLQNKVKEMVDNIDVEKLNSDDLIYSGVLWGKLSYDVYKKLKKESEYAAWLYANGFRANHFTVSINNLKTFSGIVDVNEFLKENGFKLNSSGGEIKGSKEQLLEQSSIIAGVNSVEFIEGKKEIPACYYEFAKRYKDEDGKLFGGFIAKSADKIFESTDSKTKS